jgi:hypothetical protein
MYTRGNKHTAIRLFWSATSKNANAINELTIILQCYRDIRLRALHISKFIMTRQFFSIYNICAPMLNCSSPIFS